MPVDNSVILAKISDLEAKKTSLKKTVGDISNSIFEFESIQANPDGSIPIDAGTGTVMTDERRQKIYDMQIAIANGLLS